MAQRITKADLDNLAEQLTTVMRELAIIPEDSSIIRAGTYGGHALHRLNADTGRAVLNALWAAKYAR